MFGHFAENYFEENFVIGHGDRGARFSSVLAETDRGPNQLSINQQEYRDDKSLSFKLIFSLLK